MIVALNLYSEHLRYFNITYAPTQHRLSRICNQLKSVSLCFFNQKMSCSDPRNALYFLSFLFPHLRFLTGPLSVIKITNCGKPFFFILIDLIMMGENVKSEKMICGEHFFKTLLSVICVTSYKPAENSDYKSDHCLIFVATLSGGNSYETDLVLKKFMFT